MIVSGRVIIMQPSYPETRHRVINLINGYANARARNNSASVLHRIKQLKTIAVSWRAG